MNLKAVNRNVDVRHSRTIARSERNSGELSITLDYRACYKHLTNAVMKEIEGLIPHRTPFLFVDKIVSMSNEEIIGQIIFHDSDGFLSGSFPQFNFVPGVILIEAMAQCGGAGIKKLGLADGLFGLANIEAANFYAGVEYGSVFQMKIRNIKIAEKYIKQSGLGIVDGKTCVELSWLCVRF